MEKAVYKATRKDAVHPKQKHVDTLIQMTLSGASMEELFMLIQDRFSEANWVISLKALTLVHILMHEGNGPMMFDYLIHRPNTLDMARFRDRHGTKGVAEFEQSKNVRTYAAYLGDKVLAYKAIRIDHVTQRQPAGSQIFIKRPTDIKFMLLEVSTVQKQLHSVLKNRFDSDTLDNEATFSAFRYCLRDMLKLFQVMNFGVMKMLKTYFDMDEEDMRRALDLYKRFVKLTDRTDEYLKLARQFENIFGFTIPSLNHAPLSLSKALDDFLNMPAEERRSTISAMRQAPKSTKARRSSGDESGAAANAKMGPNGRLKPGYGLRLKPELLALSDDSPPTSASESANADRRKQTAKQDSAPLRAAATVTAAAGGSASTLGAPTGAQAAEGDGAADRSAVKEIDFIDFFSSIDDEVTPAASNMMAPTGGVGSGFGTVGAGSVGGTAQPSAASDFDTMFLALSNPFAALNTGGLDMSAALSAQQPAQPQMQVAAASSSPFSALGGVGSAAQDGGTAGMSGPMVYTPQQQQQQQQQFNAFSGAAFGTTDPAVAVVSTSGALAGIAQPPTYHQALQPQRDTSSHGGFAGVAANNPFRQSMFPAQHEAASQQAHLINQMAQLNLQQLQQQQQQQQQQVVYNPFVQRQTMYLADANATMLSFAGSSPSQFAATSHQQALPEQFASFGTVFGNVATSSGMAAGLQPQSQQQQQQPYQSAGAQNQQPANNDGGFADFDFFKR
ncbi:hypothetical protein LPJ61_003612 [Coemansia biformis]|uniref:ENTH domain-containing protein n=1 Tax=Coemansia biformis TaxID=1286918 RepID=A0A9W8CW43_9FUNG|nr:hypothetical protein LPJ61_003612 [Coemansia biformis]